MSVSTALVTDFHSWLLSSNYSANTARGYRGDLRQFLDWNGGPIAEPADLDPCAREWLTFGSEGKAPSTVKRRLATVQTYGNWIGLGDTFMAGYRPPRLGQAKAHPVPGMMAGVEQLLARAKDADEYRLVTMCALMGLRVNEAVHVTGADIDREDRTLLIRGKGDKERLLPLTDRTWPVVASGGLSVGFQRAPLIGLANSTARARVRLLGLRAGMPRPIATHDLRSTFATDMYQRTLDILAVKTWMGHSDIQTTMRYIDMGLETMREAGL